MRLGFFRWLYNHRVGLYHGAYYMVVDTSNKRFIVHRSSPPPKVGELIVLKGFSGDKLMWVITDAKK